MEVHSSHVHGNVVRYVYHAYKTVAGRAWYLDNMINRGVQTVRIGHFRVACCLFFKTSLREKPWSIWNVSMRMKLIFICRFCTGFRFQTDAKGNSEIAYFLVLKAWFQPLTFFDILLLPKNNGLTYEEVVFCLSHIIQYGTVHGPTAVIVKELKLQANQDYLHNLRYWGWHRRHKRIKKAIHNIIDVGLKANYNGEG